MESMQNDNLNITYGLVKLLYEVGEIVVIWNGSKFAITSMAQVTLLLNLHQRRKISHQ